MKNVLSYKWINRGISRVMNKVIVVLVLTLAGCVAKPIEQPEGSFFSTLFTGVEQYENFNRTSEFFLTSGLAASTEPYEFFDGSMIEMPLNFRYEGKTVQTDDFLQETDTSAVFVLKDGKVRYENYSLTGGRDVQWLSMSVAKSFISALVGIAIEEGHIGNIEEAITKYIPGLVGSAYDNVRIKDVLQMSSGARWNEDYSDPESDVARLGLTLANGGSLNAFSATLVRDKEPGTISLYNSTDTQVLGQLIAEATGRSVTDYMQEKLWQPLGMESSAYWITDKVGMEMVFGGLNATARDYAKLGQLYLDGGRWGDQQILTEHWVKASVIADVPHLTVETMGYGLGYGYQWWLMDGDDGEYSAIGVYNQFIYVNPKQGLVIVKLSANSEYGLTNEESSFRELETVEFFRAIGAQLKGS